MVVGQRLIIRSGPVKRGQVPINDSTCPIRHWLAKSKAIEGAYATRVSILRRRPQVHFYACVLDRKSTRLNSSHGYISYAVFCLKKNKTKTYDLLRVYS